MKSWKKFQAKVKAMTEQILPPEEPSYWDRYRQRAREVVRHAKGEAKRDERVPTTAYILLILLRHEDADTQAFLKRLGIDTEAFLVYVDAHVIEVEEPLHSPTDWISSSVNRVFKAADREARSLGFTRVDTLHILFGLAAVEDTWASQTLTQYGVVPKEIRAYTIERYGHLLLQPSAAPLDASALLRVPIDSETETNELLRPVPEVESSS